MVKDWGLYIVFLVMSFGLFAQDGYVHLSVSPSTISVGQSVKVTIKTNVDGKIDYKMPGGFVQSSGMQTGFTTSIKIVNNKRSIVQEKVQSFSGYFKKNGTYLFGPITVKDGKKTFQSKTISIKVIPQQNMISANPADNMNKIAFGIIQQSKRTVYVGEPVLLEGKVYSQADIFSVKNYAPFEISGTIEKHSLSKSNQVNISIENIGGRNVQTFKIGKTILFPSSPKTMTVQPFKTQIVYNSPRSFFPRQLNIVSNSTQIKVLPLPKGAPSCFINGVGKFSVAAHLHAHKIVQGNVVELRVQVRGHGNLQNVTTPKINLPLGFAFYGDTEIHDSISYSIQGAEGSKTFTYFIQCNKIGDTLLPSVKIAYFDPIKEAYKIAKAPIGKIEVIQGTKGIASTNNFNGEKAESAELQPFLTNNNTTKATPWDAFNGWGSAFLFSPIMAGLLLGFFIQRKKKKDEIAENKNAALAHHQLAVLDIEKINPNEENNETVERLAQILVNFLSKQFCVSKSMISKNFLRSKVPESLHEQTLENIVTVFNTLDAVRFGKLMNTSDVDKLKHEILIIITSFKE